LISVVLPVIVSHPWQVAMTRFCIDALRSCAKTPFQLVIVETGSRHFEEMADRYLHRAERTSLVQDWNAGADVATGDYLVHIGNDIIVQPGWDEALLAAFESFTDCGASSLSCLESGNPPIGPREAMPGKFVEGFFGPLLMFRKEWRLDPAYIGMFSDNDLIMRQYGQGLRPYRNCGAHCYHLDGITWKQSIDPAASSKNAEHGKRLFYERWADSPLLMSAMIRRGGVIYGKEHET